MAANKVQYSDKVGVTPKETHINQVWDDDMNELKLVVNDNADLHDSLETEVDANTLDIIDLKASPKIDIGILDYADLATQTTPITVIGGDPEVDIPNDGAGPFTNILYPPEGVTEVWDSVGQSFDWSELSLGDMIDIRLALVVTTSSINTAISVDLHLGSGGSAYSIPFITSTNFKSTGEYILLRFNSIYMGNTDTLNSGGVFKISSDNNISYKVTGWYCKVIKRT